MFFFLSKSLKKLLRDAEEELSLKSTDLSAYIEESKTKQHINAVKIKQLQEKISADAKIAEKALKESKALAAEYQKYKTEAEQQINDTKEE